MVCSKSYRGRYASPALAVASYPFVDLPPGNTLRCKLFPSSKFYQSSYPYLPKGLYHLSVSAWIVNQQGQYLLSQRHPKKQYPLYWECTGGSVLSGETSLQGAIREVKEELGILLTPGSEKLIYQTIRENVQDFYDVWLFHRDIKIEEMRLQETEVVDVQWVSSDKLFEMFRLKQLHPLITYVDQLIG